MNDQYSALMVIPSIIGSLAMICFVIICFIGLWKMFIKAGKPGWGVFIPVYNTYLLLKIAGKPGWWLVFYLIPFVNLIIHFVVAVGIAKAFAKSTVFGIFLVGLFPMIGYVVLGLDKSTYTGTTVPTAPQLPATPQS